MATALNEQAVALMGQRRLKDARTAAEGSVARAVDVLTKAHGPNNPELKPFVEDQRTLRKRAAR